ncbi:oxysterol-binding protein-related protein 11 isoform X2 [Ixodes scapularis]
MADEEELDAQEENKMRQPLEGQLFKYTNVVKGWQYRWFVLNPDIGMFEYYMLDELKKGRPRGAVHLAGAVISPSDEDGQMFTVSAACGEVYKLRGFEDALRSLDSLAAFDFDLPVDLAIRQLQNMKDAF